MAVASSTREVVVMCRAGRCRSVEPEDAVAERRGPPEGVARRPPTQEKAGCPR